MSHSERHLLGIVGTLNPTIIGPTERGIYLIVEKCNKIKVGLTVRYYCWYIQLGQF